MTVSFTVIGTPAPQGSKTKWGTEENPNTRPWRAAVAASAADAHMTTDGQSRILQCGEILTGPVAVHARFYFARPKSHYRTGRYAGVLKDSAPTYVSSKPDLDKLQRAVGDALTSVVLRDDSQIVRWDAAKLYGEPARAELRVSETWLMPVAKAA